MALLAKNTVKNLVATLRAILYQAQEDGLVTSIPAACLGKLFSLRHDPRQHVTVLEPDGVARARCSRMTAHSGLCGPGPIEAPFSLEERAKPPACGSILIAHIEARLSMLKSS